MVRVTDDTVTVWSTTEDGPDMALRVSSDVCAAAASVAGSTVSG